MKEYILHWISGKIETVKGYSIADAFMKAGYSQGALRALDYYDEIKEGTVTDIQINFE